MPLLVNLRHLEAHSLTLEGELPAGDLDINTGDPAMVVREPLHYDIEVENIESGVLVEGRLSLGLTCQCVRCLKEFRHEVVVDPWTVHLPLAGEDAVPVVSDCIDLTPFIREDILLEFPQHPLCEAECRGLPDQKQGSTEKAHKAGPDQEASSAWAELNKLKLK